MERYESVPCPSCGRAINISAGDTTGTCPSCGVQLEVLEDDGYWQPFAMWLLGILTGVGAVVGGATAVGYKLYKTH